MHQVEMHPDLESQWTLCGDSARLLIGLEVTQLREAFRPNRAIFLVNCVILNVVFIFHNTNFQL